MESMESLGREAVQVVKRVAKLLSPPHYYVNKTAKYVSIKIVTDHLTDEQLAKAKKMLESNPRFLKVHNGTSKCSACRMSGELFFSVEWDEPKVMVRFTQKR